MKQYLLGRLDEATAEELELRLLTDPEYAYELDLAVEELTDAYVDGELDGEEREQMQDHFFRSAERKEKLRFAMMLKKRKSRQIPRIVPKRQPVMRYLAIAASIVVVVGIGLVGWRTLRPQPDLKEGLIALQKAFPQERPVEARVSDFNYVPLPNQRGGSPQVDNVQRDLAGSLILKSLADRNDAASHHAAGKYYLLTGQFDQADREFTAALALDPNNAKIHSDFGAALIELGRRQSGEGEGKELETFGRSLEQLQKALELDNTLLEARFNRALLFQYMKSPAQAKTAWEEYLQRDSTSPWADEARRNLKLIEQEQRGKPRSANDSLKEFLQAKSRADDHAAWTIVSESYTSAGNLIANRLIDSFLQLEPDSENLNTHDSLPALSYLATLEGNHFGDRFTADLVSYYRRVTPQQKPILANARRHMRSGYSSFEKFELDDAIRDYQQAKLNYEQADDTTGKALVEYRLAHCYVLQPDSETARILYDRLLPLCEKNQYRWLAAQCLFGLAHATVDTDEFTKAIEYGEQAWEQFRKFGDVHSAILSLTQLADFNQAINRIDKSLGYLSKALLLARSTESQRPEEWGVLNQIGFSMSSLQLPVTALFYQQAALDLAIQLNNRLYVSRSYGYVGTAYAAMKMYPEALRAATQAYDIGAQSKQGKEVIANASLHLGEIYREAGQCDKAVQNYDRSLDLYRTLKSDNYAYEAQKGKLDCFIATSQKAAVQRQLTSVLQLSERYRSKITTELQRNSFFDLEQGVYDLAISYESGIEGNYERAFEYSEKSRARSLLDEVQSGAKLRKKQGEIDVSLPVVTPSLSLGEIQSRMPAQAQILEYAVLDDRVVAWIVTGAKVEHQAVPVKAEVLTEKVGAFLERVNRPPAPSDNSYRERASELYSLLIEPIADRLDKSRTLCIVPDKILNYLPYAALISPKTGGYLIDEYDLDFAASAALFVSQSAAAERKARKSEERLLVVGNPKFSRRRFPLLRDLPSSELECNSVAQIYRQSDREPKVLLRDEATETAVEREMKQADVAHFAMHFVLNERSEMFSGFPLTPEVADAAGSEGSAKSDPVSKSEQSSDGVLQSYEIYGMNLRRTRLVVLSACQTGIERQYRGEGAVGAARPFFVAGVPTVVASLWPVDSDASADLMVSFHKHLHERLSAPQALRSAQREMLASGNATYHHPYYWAPFLAIGGLSQQ